MCACALVPRACCWDALRMDVFLSTLNVCVPPSALPLLCSMARLSVTPKVSRAKVYDHQWSRTAPEPLQSVYVARLLLAREH